MFSRAHPKYFPSSTLDLPDHSRAASPRPSHSRKKSRGGAAPTDAVGKVTQECGRSLSPIARKPKARAKSKRRGLQVRRLGFTLEWFRLDSVDATP